ncbi:Ti-type conjugative transfer relaxase TraA [Legionella spiritensis]|uniref:Conjugal transfer protein TraA n=1 Tax=Legionella spiritensis TaxID=452 RepID=A0A0W0Z8F0_LEGSP|nr:Ti-type conjugative transfer relaxase TraA [Legionella spiritensis]KTD65373.1 Conjugal transfer protein TraA [Legionella spiritensis]SNV47202.1 Conjugal transfer protein TraA [Legionella spiritensis]
MAIAFARVSIHSRSKGHSVVAAAAYRSGQKLQDSRTGFTHDFSNRHDVVFSEILLPEGCDESFLNREFLWNQAELAESRCDAQVCKDVVLALPKELDLIQQVELAKRFAQTYFVENGLPADIAIHDHGDDNPHAHILISTRRLEKDGFSRYKARDLNPAFAKGFVVENDYWGEQWRDFQNDFFIDQNIDLSVDVNHILSERHHGKMKDGNRHYLREENQLIREARRDITRDSIENLINHISLQCSVFSRRDVERLLFKTFKDSQNHHEYLTLVERVLNHKDVIKLGPNDLGRDCYTTRHQYIQEARLRSDIEKMMTRRHHVFGQSVDGLAQRYALSGEQIDALRFITQGQDISVVVGRPGAGKSYLLKPVKEYYEQHHCQVIGASLSGKVAKALQQETGIASSTLASLSYRLINKQLQLTDKHVIIVDEAGMVDFANMALLLKEARKAGSKVILVGDPDQLKPIHKGEIFRGIAAYTGYIELDNIRRQNDLDDRKASLNLAKGHIDEALRHYHNQGAVSFHDTVHDAANHLVLDWQQAITPDTIKGSIMLAFTRAAVADLNDKARGVLQEKQWLGREDIIRAGFERELMISSGERLLFRQNDKVLGVRNGDLGTVKAIDNNQLHITLDSGEQVSIPKSYRAIDYGYALTVHKSQGMTTEHARVLIDSKFWDRHLSFVAMTRHKQNLKLYADKVNHPDLNALKQTLSRSTTKDNVIDWPLDFATRCGFDPDKLIGRVVNHLAGVASNIKDKYHYVLNYESHQQNQAFQKREQDIRDKRTLIKETMPDKTAFDQLKKEYPILAQYEQAVEQRKKLSGYFAEKKDKEIRLIVKTMIENKVLNNVMKETYPVLYDRLQAHFKEKMPIREK